MERRGRSGAEGRWRRRWRRRKLGWVGSQMETQLFRCGQTFRCRVELSRYQGRKALPENFAVPAPGAHTGADGVLLSFNFPVK